MLESDSYDNVENYGTTLQVVNENLNMLDETGATGITIHMGYDPWIINLPNTINEENTITSEIKANGKALMLADASAEYYRHHRENWDQFKSDWVTRVTTLAKLYHPAYYTVIKEPPWYIPMIAGISRNTSSPPDQQIEQTSQWISLLKSLITAVKAVSPSTKVGIAVSGDLYNGSPSGKIDSAILQGAIQLKQLDYIGFDIYTATAFENTTQFLKSNGSGGKQIWIAEAWSSTTAKTGDSTARSNLDVSWARFLINYAQYIGATGVVPFYTDFFASYSPHPDSTQGLLSFYNERTPIFYEFQKLLAASK